MRIINILSDGFWDWITCKGLLNAYEYKLRILAYILYTPIIVYCVIMGGITLIKYHYPWTMNLEWVGTILLLILSVVGFIGSIRNYREFKRGKYNAAA
jgi:hypothetical protein